jgi:hypothetical protein
MNPIVTQSRSFTEWRRAADRLLKLESAFSHGKRAPSTNASPTLPELEAAVMKMRETADALFAVAMAEAANQRSRAEGALLAGPGKPLEGFYKPTLV